MGFLHDLEVEPLETRKECDASEWQVRVTIDLDGILFQNGI